MDEMSILEYLAFEDVPREVKATLKKIYFNVPGGKNAVIIFSPMNATFMCKYMESERINMLTNLHHKHYKTLEISGTDGRILREKEHTESVEWKKKDIEVPESNPKKRK